MRNALKEKISDLSWDFRGANTKQDTHCYHNYPAMMIPQIAERLLDEYGASAKTLFDPYCGTGTSLVEANKKSIDAHGTDLNPLARLIAKTKTLKIELQVLNLYLKEFNDFSFSINFEMNRTCFIHPNFKNIDFWFKEEIKDKLSAAKYFIDNIEDKKVKKFFLIAFSEVVRESSLTRNGEFKLYRMPEEKIEKFNPDVFAMINSKLARNRNGLISYLEKIKNSSAKTIVHDFNSSDGIDEVEKESIDIIVTSPPYGDSRTTVAYGQFSRLANQWLGIENAAQVDNQLMGGKTAEIKKTDIGILDDVIEEVGRVNVKRAKEVYSFYKDYIKSIANVSTTIKKEGHACYVVGNRRVKGITLPTDEITKSIFERHGFEHKITFVRNIPNKRMPSKNSPTNKIGHKATTMNNEYIVVMQKH